MVEVFPVDRFVCVIRLGGVARLILLFLSSMVCIAFPMVLFRVLAIGSHSLWCPFRSPHRIKLGLSCLM